jgi:hypothetical protein
MASVVAFGGGITSTHLGSLQLQEVPNTDHHQSSQSIAGAQSICVPSTPKA